jgi:hypothetical protein
MCFRDERPATSGIREKFDLDAMKTQFMSEGKKWKLIGKKSNRKSPKVVAVFDIMDKKGDSYSKGVSR